MIFLIHQNSHKVIKVLKEAKPIDINSTICTEALWELAARFPDELIGWREESLEQDLAIENWGGIFHHDLIMASFAVKTTYLPDGIGYIDQLPFVNINQKVLYGTWRMSSDIGGIKGKALLNFRNLFSSIRDLDLLLNSVAKQGQQNGLFCYSAPQLVKKEYISNSLLGEVSQSKSIKATASINELFAFVYAHYKTARLFILFWCYVKYEKRFPLANFLKAFFQKKYFKKRLDLSRVPIQSAKQERIQRNIDVIIPTLGRKSYLLQVLEDLEIQTLLPAKVIIVEQNPEPDSKTDLPELKGRKWPFEVIHHFTHQTGACNARNIALDETRAKWVFFADDDNKMERDVLENALLEIKRLGVDLLTLKYSQEGEALVFDKVKQWGTFGAGNSIVAGKFASKIRFDMAFEEGYAEDKDYGMQLRNAGCDIVYHSKLEILHLKAPRGGFRGTPAASWEKEKPKPSPTLMVYAKKYYTPEQLKGFKTELFLRYYFRQKVKNPLKYLEMMRKRWRRSEEWAKKLMSEKENWDIKSGLGDKI